MTQQLAIGLGLVLGAGFLQGSFMLPLTLTRRWQWEHGWAMFSLLGMLLFNVALAACAVPHLLSAYLATPAGDLCVLAVFGAVGRGRDFIRTRHGQTRHGSRLPDHHGIDP